MNSELNKHHTRGFTMIELMITMVIGMVVLAGVVSLFINNTRLAATLADRTERLGDLYTASHIIQTEMRSAQGRLTTLASGGGVTTLTYTPVDPELDPTTGASCGGHFEYKTITNSNPPRFDIKWLRPGISTTTGSCKIQSQQLIRDLDPTNGMIVRGLATVAGVNPYSFLNIDLYSLYADPERNSKTVSLSFKVWSRN